MSYNKTLAMFAPNGATIESNDLSRIQTVSNRKLITFDDSVSQYISFVIPRFSDLYQSGTLTLTVFGFMDTATSGTCILTCEVEAVTTGDSLDFDTSESYDTANSASVTVPATAGQMFDVTITLTNKDSVTAGDLVRIRITRDATDTATGDYYFLGATLIESVTILPLEVYSQITVPDGTVDAPAIAHAGDTDTGIYFGTNTINLATNGIAALAINSSQAATFTGAITTSCAGAASVPALYFTGTPFLGDSTTSIPMVSFIPTGATIPTSWNTTGIFIGGVLPSGFAGNIFEWRASNGTTSVFRVTSAGSVQCQSMLSLGNVTGTNFAVGATNNITFTGRGSITSDSSSNIVTSGGLIVTTGITANTLTTTGDITLAYNRSLLWSGRGVLTSQAVGNIQLGLADAASPVAQTLSVQSVLAGTSSTSAVDFTIQQALPTGSGTPGNLVHKAGFSAVIQTAKTCTISNGVAAVITSSAHGFVPGQALTFATSGSLPTGLTVGTTYYVISSGISSSAFRVSATLGGTAVDTSSAGSGIHTLTTLTTAQSQAVTTITHGPSGLTGSQTTSAFEMTQSWNTTGSVDGFRLNYFNAASNAASSYFRIVVGGSQVFVVSSNGNLVNAGALTAGSTATIGFSGLGTIASMGTNQITIGPRDTTSAAAQKLRAQSVASGGAIGADFSIVGSLGFGAFDSGNMLFKVGVQNGASQATETTALTLAAETLAATFAGAITAGAATFSGVSTFSQSAASGAAGINITGSPFAGNGTTSLPVMYFNNAVTQPTSLHGSGTYLAFNAASGFVGRFFDCHVNGGVSVFSITSSGGLIAAGDLSAASLTSTGNIILPATSTIQWTSRGSLTSDSSSNIVTSGGLVVTGGATFSGQVTNSIGTITTSQPFTVSQTWNNAGVVFSGLVVNITPTALGAASKFLDIQNAGSTVCSVSQQGIIQPYSVSTTTAGYTLPAAAGIQWTSRGSVTSDSSLNIVVSNGVVAAVGSASNTSYAFAGFLNWGLYKSGASSVSYAFGGTEKIKLWTDASIYCIDNSALIGLGSSTDTFIGRNAAANVRLGNVNAASPIAQTLSVQSVLVGTTNTAGTDFRIESSAPTGTAEPGKIILSFYGNGSSGSTRPATNYTYQFTRSSLTGPSAFSFTNGSYSAFLNSNSWTATAPTGNNATCHVFISANQTMSNGSDHYDFRHTMTVGPTSGASKFYGASLEHTINQTGTASGDYTGLRVNVTKTAFLGTSSKFFEGQIAGTNTISIFDSGKVAWGSGIGDVVFDRVSAGILGVTTGAIGSTRINPRVVAESDSTTWTPVADTSDVSSQTNTQIAGTLTVAAPTYTVAPVDGQQLMLRIKSTNIQTFDFNAIYRASTDSALPSASSGGGLWDYLAFRFNYADTKWDYCGRNLGH